MLKVYAHYLSKIEGCSKLPSKLIQFHQFQNSDFGGELSPAQLKYCANDVIYLHKIKNELEKMLIREKRFDLYKRCINFLDTRVELDQTGFKFDIFEH